MEFSIPKAKSKKEERYIFYRKAKAFINSLAFYLCRVFSINKTLVSVCSFEGKGGFGCNPKYLVEELHKRNPEYEFVWFVNKDIYDAKEFPSYIRKVPNTLWSRAYWLSRSGIWIDNYRKPYGTVKRKGQYYINVNHYTICVKTVGLWRGDGFSKMAYLVSKNDSDMIDVIVTDSKFCDVMSPKGLVYGGTFLKTGAPRCDVLFGDRIDAKKSFRKKHNIPDNSKVVMFAPTFREGSKNGVRSVYSEIWTIDFESLLRSLELKFGGDWYLCVRVHPQLAAGFREYKNSKVQERLIDESGADDMYEILSAMDVYITDYSSACFEAGYAGLPVFIYADDIEKYEKDRGALFWKLCDYNKKEVSINDDLLTGLNVKFPFSIASNNTELNDNIRNFDNASYKSELNKFHQEIGLVFDGMAGKRLAEIIDRVRA